MTSLKESRLTADVLDKNDLRSAASRSWPTDRFKEKTERETSLFAGIDMTIFYWYIIEA